MGYTEGVPACILRALFGRKLDRKLTVLSQTFQVGKVWLVRRGSSRVSKLRFITLFPVAFGLLSSLLMSVIGAGKAIKALQIYLFAAPLNESVPAPPNLDSTDQAIIAVVESVDRF